MVNTTLIFSLLLSISAMTTSFAALAENSDCPPGAAPNSLCQQFQVTGVVPEKTDIKLPDKLLTLQRKNDVIEGETGEYSVTSNSNAKEITVRFGTFTTVSKNFGLTLPGDSAARTCSFKGTSESRFSLKVELYINDKEYIEFINGSHSVPFIENTARFRLKFTSVDKFGEKGQGLEKLGNGEYSCTTTIFLTVPA